MGRCVDWEHHGVYLVCWKLRKLGEVKSVSLQGDIVITGDLFLIFINIGGERSVEKGKRLGRGGLIGL